MIVSRYVFNSKEKFMFNSFLGRENEEGEKYEERDY